MTKVDDYHPDAAVALAALATKNVKQITLKFYLGP